MRSFFIAILFVFSALPLSTRLVEAEVEPVDIVGSKHFSFQISKELALSHPTILLEVTPVLNNHLNFLERTVWEKIPAIFKDKICKKINYILVPDINPKGIAWPDGQVWIDTQVIKGTDARRLLIHELFHALHYQLNPNEVSWVREGLAQLFEYFILDSFHAQNLFSAWENPSTPFFHNYDPSNVESPAQYGHHLLYFFYLYSQCGGNVLFWMLANGDYPNSLEAKQKLRGKENIQQQLKVLNIDRPQCQNFEESLISFEIAKIHNHQEYRKRDKPNSDSKRYFLFPMQKRPLVSYSLNVEKDLKNLIPYIPLAIKMADLSLAKQECHDCFFYFLKKNYPFDVTFLPPSPDESDDWIILVLKKN